MKKSEVCVKLTRKNCKKVLGILEMFGEKPSPGLKEILENPKCIRSQEHIEFNLYTKTFYRYGFHPEGKTLVKPRQLRNILAKEHLKKGDVVKIKTLFGQKRIVEVTDIDRERFSFTSIDGNLLGAYDINDLEFLRYATDEEKSLLDPKKVDILDNLKSGDVIFLESKGFSFICEVDGVGADNLNAKKASGVGSGYIFNSGHFIKNSIQSWRFATEEEKKKLYPDQATQTYTREVWVNHYSDMEFHIHYNKEIAELHSRINNGFGKDVQTVKATLTYDIPMTKV